MDIGPYIRKIFGPFERYVTDLYRAVYFDLTSFVSYIKHSVPVSDNSHILEVGCGEGGVISLLVRSYPNAYITGIDITPRVGRLFCGDRSRVVFVQQSTKDFIIENRSAFDSLIISDVMHHIPPKVHREFLFNIRKAVKSKGFIILKEWERRMTPIHLLSYFSDRCITGDRVFFRTVDEWRDFIKEIFGQDSIKDETRIRPWLNNIVFVIQV